MRKAVDWVVTTIDMGGDALERPKRNRQPGEPCWEIGPVQIFVGIFLGLACIPIGLFLLLVGCFVRLARLGRR